MFLPRPFNRPIESHPRRFLSVTTRNLPGFSKINAYKTTFFHLSYGHYDDKADNTMCSSKDNIVLKHMVKIIKLIFISEMLELPVTFEL